MESRLVYLALAGDDVSLYQSYNDSWFYMKEIRAKPILEHNAIITRTISYKVTIENRVGISKVAESRIFSHYATIPKMFMLCPTIS